MTKRIDVQKVRDRANELLALPEGGAWDGKHPLVGRPGFREGVASLLEFILHESDNYRGHNLQSSQWLPEEDRDYRPGSVKMIRDDADETRKVYY